MKSKAVFLILSIGAVALVGCKPKQQTSAPTPPTVEIVEVKQADVPIVHNTIGTLDGSDNAAIQAQITGYLLSQKYKDGEFVKKGDLLFEIDDRPFQALLDQAKATLAQSEANFQKAKMDVERYTPLAATDAISRQELDDAVQAQAATKASVDAAKAELEQAKINLSYTKIRSPIDGIAGISNAQVGELITASRGNLTVVSTINPIKVNFTITEQAYLTARAMLGDQPFSDSNIKNMQLELVLSDDTIFPEKGRVCALDRQVSGSTGTINVQAIFPNPRSLLRPGQYADVRAIVREEKGALLIPQRAVTELQGAYLVAKVGAGNKIAIVKVEVGERHGTDWIIKSGLKAGEKIVAEGTQKARDGVVVTPVPFKEIKN